MKDKIKIEDYQFSLWLNSTRVSVTKVKFREDLLPYIEKAIDDIMKNQNDNELPVSKVPFTIFPELAKSMHKYCDEKNRMRKCDFILLYYKHSVIGQIKQDIPKTTVYCALCGNVLEERERVYKYTWWQKIIRRVFKDAFEGDSETFLSCPIHGEKYEKKVVTM